MVLGKIKKAINEYLKEGSSKNKIIGIGISIPNPYIKNEGKITLMTEFLG